MPKISVIVPIYNVRRYLEKCVASVLGQTETDWELLLINDGSTDDSAGLAAQLAGSDERIRFFDLPNRGVGAARNTGLDEAKGEYVTFLDSDDAYLPEHLRSLLDTAGKAGADVAAGGALVVDEQDREIETLRLPAGVHTGTPAILEQFLCRSDGLYACWNKLYRRDTIGETRFTAHTRAEDALFCVRVLSRAGVYATADSANYLYLRREQSVTMRPSARSLQHQLQAWEEIYALLAGTAPELCPFAAEKICHDADTICRPLLSDGEGRALVRRMRLTYEPLRYAPGKRPLRKKLSGELYRLSPELYYRLAGR